LVAGCAGGVHLREFSGCDVEVGAANAAGFHAEEDFAGAGLGNGQVFEDQRARGDGGGMVEDGCAHLFLD
jgi:hypothetical protein